MQRTNQFRWEEDVQKPYHCMVCQNVQTFNRRTSLHGRPASWRGGSSHSRWWSGCSVKIAWAGAWARTLRSMWGLSAEFSKLSNFINKFQWLYRLRWQMLCNEIFLCWTTQKSTKAGTQNDQKFGRPFKKSIMLFSLCLQMKWKPASFSCNLKLLTLTPLQSQNPEVIIP